MSQFPRCTTFRQDVWLLKETVALVFDCAQAVVLGTNLGDPKKARSLPNRP